MKNKFLLRVTLVLVATLMFCGISANAQSLEQRLKVNVPFDFSVGDDDFPSGEYLVQRAQPSSGDLLVRVSSLDGKATTVRMTFPVLSLEPTYKGKLVFTRYGNQYFLSEIWPLGSNTGRSLPKSKHERELSRNYPYEIGSTTAKTTVVIQVR
jgi:hypothetical protein